MALSEVGKADAAAGSGGWVQVGARWASFFSSAVGGVASVVVPRCSCASSRWRRSVIGDGLIVVGGVRDAHVGRGLLVADGEAPLEVTPVVDGWVELGQMDDSGARVREDLAWNGRAWAFEVELGRSWRDFELNDLAGVAVVLDFE